MGLLPYFPHVLKSLFRVFRSLLHSLTTHSILMLQLLPHVLQTLTLHFRSSTIIHRLFHMLIPDDGVFALFSPSPYIYVSDVLLIVMQSYCPFNFDNAAFAYSPLVLERVNPMFQDIC